MISPEYMVLPEDYSALSERNNPHRIEQILPGMPALNEVNGFAEVCECYLPGNSDTNRSRLLKKE